jgi:hypothetical protein
MPNKKPPGSKSGRVICDERYVTRAEFKAALETLQKQIEAIHGVPRQDTLELAPRPPVLHKRKMGRRYKLASTVDGALYDRIRELESEGFQLAHLIDSAFRLLFGRPKLSFEVDTSED